MNPKTRYIHRDISWLSFNARILEESKDPAVPLYDRIKFLAIWSSNLDEFFRVRVASLQSLKKIQKKKLKKELEFKPKKTLKKVFRIVEKQQLEYGRILTGQVLPELKENNIVLHWNRSLLKSHKNKLHNYFRSRVLSFLQPVMIGDGKKKSLFLENRAIYLVVKLKTAGAQEPVDPRYAFLNIPTGSLPRFISLFSRTKHHIIFLDDLIRANLDIVFPGFEIMECYSIKLNRDADLNIDDEYSGDLIDKIKKHLSYRKINLPSRFLYDKRMPEDMLRILIENFGLESSQIVKGGIYHNLNDLSQLPNPEDGSLTGKKMNPLKINDLEVESSIFHSIENKDYVLHLPYQTYDYVLRFFNEAAIDPEVRQIKVTLYRIAENSLIANALISAARNGKKVIVFVEIKARFDEENNLYWADLMKKAGIRIIYSMPGLKVHAKTALIKRKSSDGKLKVFGFLGTGNFNEITARIYADEGLFTANRNILKEVDAVFKFLEKGSSIKSLKHLLVSQFNIVETLKGLVDREIDHVKHGTSGKIILKMNNLEDKEMIDKLYEASNAGVEITVIVRGICCLKPGIPGLSDHITVLRIVDSILEHSRIFIFFNDGEPEILMGSADWMTRNLRHRIEVVFPVYDPGVREEILQMIDSQLSDNTKSRMLDQYLVNQPAPDHLKPPVKRAQVDFYNYLKKRYGAR
ncbi:MAG: polyphosphate kinase 1 [Cyclobacteriaceae bacterium]|nr:polyphosphate kinase 1 [Cyclobacteriaceae bacterium]